MTTMTEAGYKREQAKKKKAAAAKAKAKKKAASAKAKTKTKALGSCAKVRQIADRNPKAKPAEIYRKCEAAGIHPRTTRAEYSNWCKAKFGKTPSERFGKSGKGAKNKTPKGKTTAGLRAA